MEPPLASYLVLCAPGLYQIFTSRYAIYNYLASRNTRKLEGSVIISTRLHTAVLYSSIYIAARKSTDCHHRSLSNNRRRLHRICHDHRRNLVGTKTLTVSTCTKFGLTEYLLIISMQMPAHP